MSIYIRKDMIFLKTIALAVLSAVFIALVIADSMRKVKENKEHSKD